MAAALSWRDPTPLLKPRSIGIIGASPSARWVEIFLEQIPRAGFAGPLWPINPSYERIGETRCYASVRNTPEVPEHVILHVGAERTLAVLEEAAAAGVKSATIYSTGWGEADDEGKARQEQLRAFCERTGFRICGPNCLGFMSVREGVIAYPLRVLDWLRPGDIGVVFQSGALLYPFVRAGGERGAGFSYLVSCGNEVGLDAADYIKFLVEDPETKAIALLLEGVRAPDKFMAALELALDAGKPVTVMKVGRSEGARDSTLTHTGALAGSARVFDALCTRYGVAQAHSLEQLIETSRLLAVARRPAGKRAGVLLFSGSLRSQVIDVAAEEGIDLAALSPATIARANAVAPLDLRVANPLDCGVVHATQPKYIELGRALLADDNVDLLLIAEHAPDPRRNRDPRLLAKLAAETRKPVLALGEIAFSRTAYTDEFTATAGIPLLQGIDRGLKAVGHLVRHAAALREHARKGRAPSVVAACADPALGAGLHWLAAAAPLLSRFGVPVVAHRLVRTADEAVAAAAALGFPVALKIESADIAHKSDAGGVRLGLTDAAGVRTAWDAMMTEVARSSPRAHITGALVSAMAAPGLEMSVGVERDPQFGLVAMVGLGGVWIEALGDISLRLLPLTAHGVGGETEARRMLGELKGAKLLGPFRGAPARDVDALVGTIVAMCRLGESIGDRLQSVEINPLIVHAAGAGASAVDARLVLT